MSFQTYFLKTFLMIFLGLTFLSMGSCSSIVKTSGNFPDPNIVSQLEEGQITKGEVAELLGSPSTVGNFGDDSWFYINERDEQIAWFEREIKQRQVLVLRFDSKGVLREKRNIKLENGINVVPVGRTTPTYGHSLGFLDQIVGNFRRFTGK